MHEHSASIKHIQVKAAMALKLNKKLDTSVCCNTKKFFVMSLINS